MDDRSELFVAESACGDACKIAYPNIYDSFNSTSMTLVDSSLKTFWVTDAKKPFEAYTINDTVCFEISPIKSMCQANVTLNPITKIAKNELKSAIEEEELLGYLSLMPRIDTSTGKVVGKSLLGQLKDAKKIPK
jgi:hypothetical protein